MEPYFCNTLRKYPFNLFVVIIASYVLEDYKLNTKHEGVNFQYIFAVYYLKSHITLFVGQKSKNILF